MASNDFWKVRKGIVIKSTPADPSTPDNGSLWYNSTLNKFRKRENGVTIDLDDSGSDVHGPGASTDNAVVRWDGTTGQTTQNSTVTISDAGIVAGASIDADTNTITNIENADIKAGAAIDAAKIHDGSVSNTEYGYLDGVTSSIQTQFSNKVTGPASATDNAVVRYNLTTGKLAQDSLVTISDTGAVTGLTTLVASGSVTAASLIPTSATIPANGMYLHGTGVPGISSNSLAAATFSSNGTDTWIGLHATSGNKGIILNQVTNGVTAITGGNSSSSAGNIHLYGQTHATKANDIELRSATAIKLGWDDSATLWTATGTFNITQNAGIGGTASSSFVLRVGETNPLTGATQVGVGIPIAGTSAATGSIEGIRATANTGAAFTAPFVYNYYSNIATKFVGSTITRRMGFAGDPVTGGTNNAFLSDNFSFTGDWFINSTSSNATGLSGALDLAQIAKPSNPAASRNRLYFKSDGNLYKLDSAGTEAGNINNGGNTFGGTITIGTNDAFPISFTTNSIVKGSITSAGAWTLGAAAATQAHVINGSLTSTLSNTAASFIPTSSSIPALGIYTSFANRVTIAANSIRAAEIGESSGNGFIVLGTSSGGSSSVLSAVNDGSVAYSSSGSSNSGGNLQVFGPSHATLPNRINLRQSSTTVLSVAETTGLITIGAAASTQAHVINGSLSININADTTSRLTLGNSNSGASSFTNLILNNSGSIGSQVSINSLLSGAAASVVIASPGGTTLTRFGNTTTSKYWIVGQEASASDQFVIARGTDIAANQFLRISDAGLITIGASSSTTVGVGGQFKTIVAEANNITTAETDLQSFTVPANMLVNNGDAIEFEWFGTMTTATNKRIKLFVNGAASINTGSLAFGSARWKLKCYLHKSASDVVKGWAVFESDQAVLTQTVVYIEQVITLSSSFIVKITGTGTNTSDIIGRGAYSRWYPAH